jgi:hypothetical protein
MDAEIKRRKAIFAKLEKAYKGFPVLTEEELVKIWPNYAPHLQQNESATVLT